MNIEEIKGVISFEEVALKNMQECSLEIPKGWSIAEQIAYIKGMKNVIALLIEPSESEDKNLLDNHFGNPVKQLDNILDEAFKI